MASVAIPVPATVDTIGAAAQTSTLGPDRTFGVRANPGGTFKVYVGASSDTSLMLPLKVPAKNGELTEVILVAGQAQQIEDSSDWTALFRVTGTGAGTAVVMAEPAVDDGNLDLLQGGNAFGATYVAGSQDAQVVRFIQGGTAFMECASDRTVSMQSGAAAAMTISALGGMVTTVTGNYTVQSSGDAVIGSLSGTARIAGDVATQVGSCDVLPVIGQGAFVRLQNEAGTESIGIAAPALAASSVDYVLPEGPAANDQGMIFAATATGESAGSFGPAQQGAEYDRTEIGVGGYVQPAVGATVNVLVASSAGFHVGQAAFSPGGYYSVTAVPDATHVTIRNNGNEANLAPAATVPAGEKLRALPYGVATLDAAGVFAIVRPQVTGDAVVLLGLANGATGPVDYFANAGVGVTLRSGAGAADAGNKVSWEIRQD